MTGQEGDPPTRAQRRPDLEFTRCPPCADRYRLATNTVADSHLLRIRHGSVAVHRQAEAHHRRTRRTDSAATSTRCDRSARSPSSPPRPGSSPTTLLAPEATWHPATRRWWAEWIASPLAANLPATDWCELELAALLHDQFVRHPTPIRAAELRSRMAAFGATPADRLRLRIDGRSDGHPRRRPGDAGTG